MQLRNDAGRVLEVADLYGSGYWYLGSPYSKHPDGMEAAYRGVCRIGGWLIRRGVKVYSPIAHSHAIAEHGEVDPADHDIWLPADQPLMDAAFGLIVAQMMGWRESYGLGHEIERFAAHGKPVVYLEPR